jgi:hypothetical protein
MSILAHLVAAAQPWADLYNGNQVLQSGLMFSHLGGVLLGGGTAVVADRATLRAATRTVAERDRQLHELRRTHQVVLLGLAFTVASGVLLLAGDLDALARTWALRIKLALLGALLVNGWLITRTERTMPPGDARQWRTLAALARVSLVLWFTLVLVSTFLVNGE